MTQLGFVVSGDLHSETGKCRDQRLRPDHLCMELEDLQVPDFVASHGQPHDAWGGLGREQAVAQDELVLSVRPQLEGVALGGGVQEISPRAVGIAPEDEWRRGDLAAQHRGHFVS